MEREAFPKPPVVLPPLDPIDSDERGRRHTWRDAGDWLDRALAAESYGAPRVFDLFTLLAITLAFALLLAFLRLLEPLLWEQLEAVAIVIGLFVTGIGLFQMVLWGGKKPRLSSLVAGPVLWLPIYVALTLDGRDSSPLPLMLIAGIFSCVLGIPAGYLGGAMVAGVFLLADFFRIRYLRTPKPSATDNDDQVFADDSPPP